MKELTVEARIENLDNVTDFVLSEIDDGKCPKKTQTQIMIAVEEVFVNISNYAYYPDIGNATVRVAVNSDDVITIEFEDSGKAFNPLENTDPDISSKPEEREIGGLGIFMVKKIMDSVEYEYRDKKNILKLLKQLSKPNH